MATVNLYTVLNLENDCTKNDIKRSYRKLVMEYHPDRPGGDEEMFELVHHAYNILHNPKTRKEYDRIFNISKQAEADFIDLKTRSVQYMESQKDYTNITSEDKNTYKKDFEKKFNDLDRKHGFIRDSSYYDIIDEKDAKKRMKDLRFAREQEDIETTHEKIFDDNEVDFLQKFNEAFELKHKTQLELIPHVGNPEAWDLDSGSTYGNIDNYEDLYIDEVGTSTEFGTLKFDNDTGRRLTKEEVSKLKGASYVHGHKETPKDYDKELKRRMEDHKSQIGKYNSRERADYNTDSSCGGYGIFDKIGISSTQALEYDNQDINKKYQKMLESRRNRA